MLLPKQADTKKQKGFALITTGLLVLILYVFLTVNSISDPKNRRVILAELTTINLSDFTPKITPVESVKNEDENTNKEEVIPEEEIPPAAPERIDLSQLLSETMKPDLSAAREVETPQNQRAQPQENRSLQVDNSTMGQLDGLRTLRGHQNNLGLNQRSGNPGGSRLELSDGAEPGLRSGGLGGIRGTGLSGGPQARTEDDSNTLSLLNLSEFGDDFDNMDPVVNQLISWVKDNPKSLPVAVQRMMSESKWENKFLSSSTRFTAGDKRFELLLMIKEEIPELHIFLIENDNATYLIDRGFQKESSFLRKGSVRYRENRIVEVDSQMRPASTNETMEFYQIFLSWWGSMNTQ